MGNRGLGGSRSQVGDGLPFNGTGRAERNGKREERQTDREREKERERERRRKREREREGERERERERERENFSAFLEPFSAAAPHFPDRYQCWEKRLSDQKESERETFAFLFLPFSSPALTVTIPLTTAPLWLRARHLENGGGQS